jgi:hypothetical protein
MQDACLTCADWSLAQRSFLAAQEVRDQCPSVQMSMFNLFEIRRSNPVLDLGRRAGKLLIEARPAPILSAIPQNLGAGVASC